jgi:cyclopropane fatty-acyl-phospholipid synthase-like methyltransferase
MFFTRKRNLSPDRAAKLEPGAEHYRAYVGPPGEYDVMGATQFRLLTALGLRETHKLLDFGCGSLRAGRLLIPYLLPGHYFGLEPNKWLIEDGIERELGRDILRVKRPTFRHDEDFRASHFGVQFDFIVAQSIFSHTGKDLAMTALSDFRTSIKADGLLLVTFLQPQQLGNAPEFTGSGWVYPECVAYSVDTVIAMASECGLHAAPLDWPHPRQTWFAMAHSSSLVATARDRASNEPGPRAGSPPAVERA